MATKAVRCYSVQHGDFWRGQCDVCGWHSRDLPFETRAKAEHAADLHAVLCKGEPGAPPEDAVPTAEDRRRATLLAEGGGFDARVADLFAQGIAVARTGGDVEAFLRQGLRKSS